MERAHAAAIIAAIIWHRRGGADEPYQHLAEGFDLLAIADRLDAVPEFTADELTQLADSLRAPAPAGERAHPDQEHADGHDHEEADR